MGGRSAFPALVQDTRCAVWRSVGPVTSKTRQSPRPLSLALLRSSRRLNARPKSLTPIALPPAPALRTLRLRKGETAKQVSLASSPISRQNLPLHFVERRHQPLRRAIDLYCQPFTPLPSSVFEVPAASCLGVQADRWLS
jgi:hypothetical protein